jgi:glyoxylase-like metal-dependent hydrolase (beta-lactamase superfamily II)
MPHRNGHSQLKPTWSERALGLPQTLTEVVQRRSAATEAAASVERINMMIVNAYLVGERGAADRAWALVDAGISLGTSGIIEAAAERFGRHSRPAAILLTHGHFDHVGGLPYLADYWEAPIFCHPLELPYLTGKSSYPPPDPGAGGGMVTVMSRAFPRGPYNFGRRMAVYPEDGSVPGMPGWRWIHTPGHSPGHVALFRDHDRTLIAGDAFVATQQESLLAVVTQKPKISRPPAYYTPDWQSARRSVQRLAELQPEIALTGHGPPMGGVELHAGLEHLLTCWQEDAVPHGGRYSQQSAIVDENGVQSVPPPSQAAKWQLAAGVGIAALIGVALFGRSRD